MKFLCYFLHRYVEFRVPEFESLALLYGCKNVKLTQPETLEDIDSPFYYVDLPSEEIAIKIASRSILLRGIFEIWGEGSDYEQVIEQVKKFPLEKINPFLSPETCYRFQVEAFGHVLKSEEQLNKMDYFKFIPFQGKVDLKNPTVQFWILESNMYCQNNGLPPKSPPRIFFGRQVALSDRSVVTKYALSQRRYLGPTAMDAELALIMANQSLAQSGSFVFDPFVGTGSILIAAAHFGAYTLGADIDIRVIRDGKGKDKNVWSNFQQYDLPSPLGLVRSDNNEPPWRHDLVEIFDAIVCDPPYGVRAGGRKSGGRKILNGVVQKYTIPEAQRTNHIPSTAPYSLEECLFDLLDLASRTLRIGGRLVFFYPSVRESYRDRALPNHPCLQIVANSEQILTMKLGRRLLTMVKVAGYGVEIRDMARRKHEEFRENHVSVLKESRERGENVHDVYFGLGHGEGGSKDEERTEDKTRLKYRAKYV